MIKLSLILVLALSLTACGGGGGTPASPQPAPTPAPPPDPAPTPIVLNELAGDTLAMDVSRFLTQATFGPKEEDILELVNTNGDFASWIDTQIALPLINTRQALDKRMRLISIEPTDESNFDFSLVGR
jgi:hypothetical protein